MKFLYALMIAFGLVFSSVELFAQQQEPPDLVEMAAQEAERLQTVLELEDWQLFYVDSTLQHNYMKMDEEVKELSASKVANASLYYSVQDKWMEKTDSLYKTIFTEAQWNKYLKSGAARQIKAREKRKANLNGTDNRKSKKKK